MKLVLLADSCGAISSAALGIVSSGRVRHSMLTPLSPPFPLPLSLALLCLPPPPPPPPSTLSQAIRRDLGIVSSGRGQTHHVNPSFSPLSPSPLFLALLHPPPPSLSLSHYTAPLPPPPLSQAISRPGESCLVDGQTHHVNPSFSPPFPSPSL